LAAAVLSADTAWIVFQASSFRKVARLAPPPNIPTTTTLPAVQVAQLGNGNKGAGERSAMTSNQGSGWK